MSSSRSPACRSCSSESRRACSAAEAWASARTCAEPLELGRGLVARLLQPRELLLALVPRLGEDGLQTLDLRRRALVLFLETGQVLLVRRPRLGEDCFEPLGVGREPLLVGGRGLQALELCGGVLVLLP